MPLQEPIMLNTFAYLLCQKLCPHNSLIPTQLWLPKDECNEFIVHAINRHHGNSVVGEGISKVTVGGGLQFSRGVWGHASPPPRILELSESGSEAF